MSISKNAIHDKNTQRPKVSVIIIAYNDQGHIADAIRSVCSQTLRDIEIICVDDGSQDDTLRIMEECAGSDNRIRVFPQANNGCFSARHRGIQEAEGEYVLLMDSDDTLCPEAAEASYSEAKLRGADVLEFGFNTILDENTGAPELRERARALSDIYSPERPLPEISSGGELINDCFEKKQISPYLWSKLYKNELLKAAFQYYDGEYICMAEDHIATFMILCLCQHYSRIKDRLYNYRFGAGISNSDRAICTEEELKQFGSEAIVLRLQAEWLAKIPNKPVNMDDGIKAYRSNIINDLLNYLFVRCDPDKRSELINRMLHGNTLSDLCEAIVKYAIEDRDNTISEEQRKREEAVAVLNMISGYPSVRLMHLIRRTAMQGFSKDRNERRAFRRWLRAKMLHKEDVSKDDHRFNPLFNVIGILKRM